MKKNTAISIILVLASFLLHAQSPTINWEEKPVVHKVKTKFSTESAVILYDQRLQEYQQEEKVGLVQITTTRRLIKLIDDKGVEMFNKIYLPVYNNAQIVEIKVRTILPNGTFINLPANKILDVEEDGRTYKKFAIEGIEKGSEIEYYYKVKKSATYFGLEIFQSNSTPYENAEFSIITPDYLVFSVKGYNGFGNKKDTVLANKRITTLNCIDIIPIGDEKYGNKDAHSKNVQFKFSYNLSKEKNVRIFTWNELAKNVYSNYATYTDKETKAAEGFLKKLNIDEAASEEAKIVALEDYLKTTINAEKEGIGEDADKIEKIVKTKVASYDGFKKLFIICLDKLNIKWQIVFPSKRDELPLDEELENYRLIDEMLLFFPSTGHYLDPVNATYRYPFITPSWASTKGLFLQGTTIGNFKTALASFADIEIHPINESAHNMETTIVFNKDLDSLLIHSKQILEGYGATAYRPAFTFLPIEKQEELSKDIIKSVSNSDNIQNIKVQNKALTDGYLKKPLIIEADISSADLIETAGRRIIVNIGKVIGPQVQMYQEKERQLPISIEYPHVLDRILHFTIPDGYQIKNLSDLNMNITDKEVSGKETMGFISNYTLNGNQLTINIHEFYAQTDYAVTMIEPFMKVINASADFNKVVLVVEKK